MGSSFHRNDNSNSPEKQVSSEIERDFLEGDLDTRHTIFDG